MRAAPSGRFRIPSHAAASNLARARRERLRFSANKQRSVHMSVLSSLLAKGLSILHLGSFANITSVVTSIGSGLFNSEMLKSSAGAVAHDVVPMLESIAEKQFPSVAPALR